MKKILFALLCVLCAGSSYATRYKISDIYELAKANNTEELAKVSNINGHDMYKDTAICHAIKDGNVEAYKLLLAHGAKADHACTKKIPEQDYTKFMDKVAASSATKTTGFWGLSKWLWGALGLGVVGTGAVIAASGSGGGDSGTADNTNKCDGYIASCDTGYKVVDTCQSGNPTMVKCDFDDEHYVKQNGQVYEKLNCQNGGTQIANTCSCVAGWTGDLCETAVQCGAEFTQTSCGTGYLQADTCKSGNTTYVSCTLDTEHYIEQNGQIYQKLNCQNGGTQIANTCSCVAGWTGDECDTAVTCPANYRTSCTGGYEAFGTPCKSGNNLYYQCQPIECGTHALWSASGCYCEPGYENWQSGVGCSVPGINDTENPQNIYINSTTDGDIFCLKNDELITGEHRNKNMYITKTANGDVFGVFVDDGYTSSNGVYYVSSASDNNPGTIYINKTGSGNVVGIYLESDSVLAISTVNGIDNDLIGNIIINNSGTGRVYGIRAKHSDAITGYSWQTAPAIYNASSGIIEGQVHYVDYSSTPNLDKQSMGTINIYNTNNDSDVFGIYSEYLWTNFNASGTHGGFSEGNIIIKNIGNGNVYGIRNGSSNFYGTEGRGGGSYNASNAAKGLIDITNIGAGNVFGLYGHDATNALAYSDAQINVNQAIIKINNIGNGDVYGLFGYLAGGESGAATNASGGHGQIIIFNNGTGNVYGIYAYASTNVYRDRGGTGKINIINAGSSKAFGMYGAYARNENTENSTSIINLQNLSSGTATGVYATNSAINSGTITINNIGAGSAVGIFGDENSTITNSGVINITCEDYMDNDNVVHTPTGTSGDVFGIYAKSGSTVNNSGEINIATNGTAYGIYVESGSTVTNTGTISITTSGTAYGIYAEGNSTVTNSGTITLNGDSCDGSTCDGSSSYGNHIVLNGSSLLNKGIMSAPQMNLNSMGGKVVAGLGSQFVVDNELSGDLNISSDIVMDGNQTTYVANNMIDAGDISKLNVRSASAMFDATIADNKHDIVMQMKDFNELTENASLAQFLADNYAKGNGNDLFAALKSLENMSAFNGALSGLTGLDTFTQFAHEDLSAMREISFSMNNKLFENSSRDSFDISDSTGYFSFSNSRNGGSGQYGISSNKITDNLKLGYGMAMANINTGDDNGMHRQNKMWLFYMPATYTNDGYELVVAPKAGFARSEYNRRGYNNMNYEGYIEKRIFGLMNDLRYPLNFGNWTIAPDLAFNAIVYDQSGHEDEQEFSLIIPDDRTVSVETGLGFYTKYEKTLKDGSRFKLNSGFMVYREFGDTYDIKLGIRGMDGTFSLYNNDYEYRGAANIGFDYMAGRLHVYGNAQYFMDNDNYMNFKGGVSYRF